MPTAHHLIHRPVDNPTAGQRAAMAYHFAATATVDHRYGVVHDVVTDR